MLDLELNVNRKKKKVEFSVHYKKTNTNITIKKKSNHKDSIKKAIIKGYGDRARNLCDPQYVEKELRHVKQVFIENGYPDKEVREALKEKTPRREDNEEEESTNRGIVSMPNIPTFSNRFNSIARRHRFQVANKADFKVRDLTTKVKTPLGDKNSNVVYNIPCKCDRYTYTGETCRKWSTRRKEHQSKVRLTKRDIEEGNTVRAEQRMNENDGGLARHSTVCQQGIDWERARIIGREKGWTQRKMLEGVETVKEKARGRTPLNTCNQMDQWQPTIYLYMEKT